MNNRDVKIITLCVIALFMTACAGVSALESLVMGSGRPVLIKSDDAAVIEEKTTSEYDKHQQITNVKGPFIYLFRKELNKAKVDHWVPPEVAEPAYKKHGVTLEGMVFFVSSSSYCLLRATIEKNEPLVIQLYVRALVVDEWAFYDRAYSEGKQLDVTQIDREVGDCKYGDCLMNEDIAINLTLEQLEKLAHKPAFNFKLYGKGGEAEYTINGAYFKGFLKAFNTARAKAD